MFHQQLYCTNISASQIHWWISEILILYFVQNVIKGETKGNKLCVFCFVCCFVAAGGGGGLHHEPKESALDLNLAYFIHFFECFARGAVLRGGDLQTVHHTLTKVLHRLQRPSTCPSFCPSVPRPHLYKICNIEKINRCILKSNFHIQIYFMKLIVQAFL